MPKNYPAPVCTCGQKAKLLGVRDVGYPYQADYGAAWVCLPCRAHVGTHRGTNRALGTLATAEVRLARRRAHAAFDPLWQRKMARDGCTKTEARGAAYKWLAGRMGLDRKDCHISSFGVAECDRVVEIVNGLRRNRNG